MTSVSQGEGPPRRRYCLYPGRLTGASSVLYYVGTRDNVYHDEVMLQYQESSRVREGRAAQKGKLLW